MAKFFKTKIFLVIIFCAFVGLSFTYSKIASVQASKFNGIKIVLDAGHGGRDGGSVGVNGTIEKKINLKYTLSLKDKLVDSGYQVELTRKTDDGLYSPTSTKKKMSDMKERFRIIEKANPSLVVSIHMNSFTDRSAYGALTYYRADDTASETIANLIQKSLNSYCNAPSNKAKVGDYYILNCSYYSAVLVECGFLSNPDEEKNLNNPDYMEKMINAIYSAILLYFG